MGINPVGNNGAYPSQPDMAPIQQFGGSNFKPPTAADFAVLSTGNQQKPGFFDRVKLWLKGAQFKKTNLAETLNKNQQKKSFLGSIKQWIKDHQFASFAIGSTLLLGGLAAIFHKKISGLENRKINNILPLKEKVKLNDSQKQDLVKKMSLRARQQLERSGGYKLQSLRNFKIREKFQIENSIRDIEFNKNNIYNPQQALEIGNRNHDADYVIDTLKKYISSNRYYRNFNSEEQVIVSHYQDIANQSIIKNFRNPKGDILIEDLKDDIVSGKVTASKVDQILKDKTEEALANTKKHFRKNNDVKAWIQTSNVMGLPTHIIIEYDDIVAGKSKLSLEQQARFKKELERKLEAHKAAVQHFKIGYDEKIEDGFKLTSGSHIYDDKDIVQVDLKEKVLKKNLDEIEALLYKHNNLSELEKWKLIQRHVNNTFCLDTKDAEHILDKLPSNNQNKFGVHIENNIGVCRHKSLLTKLIADRVGLKASMNAGVMVSDGKAGGHAWNTVEINNKIYLFDAHNHFLEPFTPFLKKKFLENVGKTEYEKNHK